MLITGKLPINCDVLSGWMCEVCMEKDRRPITCFGNQKPFIYRLRKKSSEVKA